MTDKQYLITEVQRKALCELIEKDGFPNKPAFDLLQSLQAVDSEPVAHMYPWDLEAFTENEMTADAFSVAVGCPDGVSVPLFALPQALAAPSEPLEELLGQYWDIGWKEGATGVPQSTDANEVLHKIRTLFKPITPITAEDITPQMHQEWNNLFTGGNMSTDGEIMAAAYNAVALNLFKHRS